MKLEFLALVIIAAATLVLGGEPSCPTSEQISAAETLYNLLMVELKANRCTGEISMILLTTERIVKVILNFRCNG